MPKDEWYPAGATVKWMKEEGIVSASGEPYKAPILKRWLERHPDTFPAVKVVTRQLYLYNKPRLKKWLQSTGRAQ